MIYSKFPIIIQQPGMKIHEPTHFYSINSISLIKIQSQVPNNASITNVLQKFMADINIESFT